jgi:hypothetical protein
VTAANDLRLGQVDEWCLNDETRSLDAAARCQVRHSLVGLDVFGPAIGIAGIVERIDANEDAARAEHFGPRQCEGEKDRIARRHVGDWNARVVRVAILGHLDVAGERGPAERAQVDVHDDVIADSIRRGDAASRVNLRGVALAISERHGVHVEAFMNRVRKQRGRIEPAAEQQHGIRLARHQPRNA